jgi:heat shock protein HslJ
MKQITQLSVPAAVLAAALCLGPTAVHATGEASPASPEPTAESTAESTTEPATEPAAEPDAAPAPAPAPAPALAFEGRPWSLAAFRQGSDLIAVTEGQGGRIASFRFEDGAMAGSVGCNRLRGAYAATAGALKFEPNTLSTMMACPEALAAQEQAVAAGLAAAAGYRVEGSLFEIQDAAGQPLLRFVALEPSPLMGPTWQLTAYNNGKQAVVSVLNDTEITLELREDGTLGGFDGCNRYMSGFTLEGDQLAFGPLATTRMACRGPEGAAEQARAYAAALGTVVGYRLEGSELTLLTAEGSIAAKFRVKEPPAPAAEPQPEAVPEPSGEAPAPAAVPGEPG